MHIYKYVHTSIYKHIYTYICIFIFAHIHVHIEILIRTFSYIIVPRHMFVYTFIYIHICIYTWTCIMYVYIYTYMYFHVCVYMYMCTYKYDYCVCAYIYISKYVILSMHAFMCVCRHAFMYVWIHTRIRAVAYETRRLSLLPSFPYEAVQLFWFFVLILCSDCFGNAGACGALMSTLWVAPPLIFFFVGVSDTRACTLAVFALPLAYSVSLCHTLSLSHARSRAMGLEAKSIKTSQRTYECVGKSVESQCMECMVSETIRLCLECMVSENIWLCMSQRRYNCAWVGSTPPSSIQRERGLTARAWSFILFSMQMQSGRSQMPIVYDLQDNLSHEPGFPSFYPTSELREIIVPDHKFYRLKITVSLQLHL